jgi:hypothetical protein
MTSNGKNHNDKKMDGRCSTETTLFGGDTPSCKCQGICKTPVLKKAPTKLRRRPYPERRRRRKRPDERRVPVFANSAYENCLPTKDFEQASKIARRFDLGGAMRLSACPH